MDFLLDSNWLVTLCGITVSLYIFVLSVPIIIQQAFLPEEVREIYNSRNRTNKSSEIYGLKKIGYAVLFFIFIFGDPAVKFFLNTIKNENERIWGFLFWHFVVFCAFLIVLREFYIFMRNNFFYSRPKKELIKFGSPTNSLPLKEKYLWRYTNRIREKAVKSVVSDLIKHYEDTGDILIEDIDDLATLSKSFQFSGDKNYILEGLKIICYEITNSIHHPYDGGKLSELIKRVLEEVIFRNPEMCTVSNFNRAKDISTILLKVYQSRGKILGAYDAEEMIIFLYKASVFLMEKSKKDDADGLLISYLLNLRNFPKASKSSYNLYKKLFSENILESFAAEFSLYCNEPDYRNENTLNNIIAFLSWFNDSPNKYMREYSQKWIKQIYQEGLITIESCTNAIVYFFNINEFNTAMTIDKMTADDFFKKIVTI